MKNLKHLPSLLFQLLIVIWIWTGGLLLISLCYAYLKTKEFIINKLHKLE